MFGASYDENELNSKIRGGQVDLNYYMYFIDRIVNADGKPVNPFWRQMFSRYPHNPEPTALIFSDQGTVSQDRDLTKESEEEFIERWKNYTTGGSSGSGAGRTTGGQGETHVPPLGLGSGDSVEGGRSLAWSLVPLGKPPERERSFLWVTPGTQGYV